MRSHLLEGTVFHQSQLAEPKQYVTISIHRHSYIVVTRIF